MKNNVDKDSRVLAVDPGRKKCGIAVVSHRSGILHREVVECSDFAESFTEVWKEHRPTQILLGGSTGSKEIAEIIETTTEAEYKLVDERHTTELAKIRYFEEYPPRGLWRFVPVGLQTPPTCYDDFAAVVMAERYIEEQANDS